MMPGPLSPISMKGISREVVPWVVDGMLDAKGVPQRIYSEHTTGVDFYLDPAMIDARTADKVREMLRSALASLDGRRPAT